MLICPIAEHLIEVFEHRTESFGNISTEFVGFTIKSADTVGRDHAVMADGFVFSAIQVKIS